MKPGMGSKAMPPKRQQAKKTKKAKAATRKYSVISFDLDGTLLDHSRFDAVFWYEEIPRLYAEQYGIPLQEAKLIVLDSYKHVGPFDINWYKPHFWFERFKLQEDWRKIIHDLRPNIRVYPEVKPTLAALKRNYKLIVVTHSTRDFIRLKMEVESIKDYFVEIHSVIEDFRAVKSKEFFYKLLEDLHCKPEEFLHVGDDPVFDYAIPRSMGIRALLVDYTRKKKGKDVVHSLADVLKCLG